jgi:Na+/H+ antiporter NhaC
MRGNISFALAAVIVLLAAAFVGRRFAGSDWQRNALSVAMVVLGLLAAFLVFFGAGLYAHRTEAQGKQQADAADANRPVIRLAALAAPAER